MTQLSFPKSKSGTLQIALIISAIIVGGVVWIDLAGAFDGTTCQVTEGRC